MPMAGRGPPSPLSPAFPHSPTRGVFPHSPMSGVFPHSPTRGSGFPSSLNEIHEHHPDHGAHSIISSRMTDISDNASDIMGLAEAQQSQQGSASRRSSLQPALGQTRTRVSVGEPKPDAFSGSRPSTAMSSSTVGVRGWTNAPPSRRGLGSVGGSLRGRPSSSASRTHAPSLTSHAFYRPMSSAKLQAQRGGKVTEEDEEQNRIRGFAQAGTTERPAILGLSLNEPIVHQLNQNRLSGDRGYGQSGRSISPTGHRAQSISSVSHLQQESVVERKFGGNANGVNGTPPLPRLDSSSGGSSDMKQKHQKQSDLGRNWQYFPGNTSFCFGGRLQTANDFPMNILTAVLICVPVALFFGFS